jgi:hypothetical protein
MLLPQEARRKKLKTVCRMMMVVWPKHVVAVTSEEEKKNRCVDGSIIALLITDQRFRIRQIRKKNGSTMRVHQLFIDFRKGYNSVRREALYNIPIYFGLPFKLFRLLQMCLNET